MHRALLATGGFVVAIALVAIAFDYRPLVTIVLAAALVAAAWPWWRRRP